MKYKQLTEIAKENHINYFGFSHEKLESLLKDRGLLYGVIEKVYEKPKRKSVPNKTVLLKPQPIVSKSVVVGEPIVEVVKPIEVVVAPVVKKDNFDDFSVFTARKIYEENLKLKEKNIDDLLNIYMWGEFDESFKNNSMYINLDAGKFVNTLTDKNYVSIGNVYQKLLDKVMKLGYVKINNSFSSNVVKVFAYQSPLFVFKILNSYFPDRVETKDKRDYYFSEIVDLKFSLKEHETKIKNMPSIYCQKIMERIIKIDEDFSNLVLKKVFKEIEKSVLKAENTLTIDLSKIIKLENNYSCVEVVHIHTKLIDTLVERGFTVNPNKSNFELNITI